MSFSLVLHQFRACSRTFHHNLQLQQFHRSSSTKSWFRVNRSSAPKPEAVVTSESAASTPESISEVPLPASAETPRLQRWRIQFITYWKGLLTEYKDSMAEAYKEGKSKPIHSSLYLSLLAGLCYFIYSNPTEESFQQELTESRESLDIVGVKIRSPKTEEYLRNLAQLSMHGQLRYLNLVLFSIVWQHDEDIRLGSYPTQLNYLKPTWVDIFGERLVDIGVLNRWWRLEKVMENYDVNEKEWEEAEVRKSLQQNKVERHPDGSAIRQTI